LLASRCQLLRDLCVCDRRLLLLAFGAALGNLFVGPHDPSRYAKNFSKLGDGAIGVDTVEGGWVELGQGSCELHKPQHTFAFLGTT
jgi:hypothetical protein